ncbi:MAG: YabP/YqfC family sporulation protein [Clostridia bacterium]
MFNFFEETVEKFGKFVGYDGEPMIVFLPGKGVYVESKNEVLSYNETSISFKTKKGVLTISGTNIKISYLDKDAFFVCGKIVNVEVVL